MSKIAIVAETMNAFGGGDRLLLALHRVLPCADIYCSVFNAKEYQNLFPNSFFDKVHPMKEGRLNLQMLSNISKRLYKSFGYLMYENLDLSRYDTVISLSARFAKFVITPVNCKHINIYITPAGYEWDDVRRKLLRHNPIKNISDSLFRLLDNASIKRADVNYSISKYIQKKIKKFYDLDTQIIYPPIESFWFEPSNQPANGDFFLVVSRLFDYKRIDMAINACIKAGKKLIIIGEGPEKKNLVKLAKGNKNIRFLPFQSDEQIKEYYTSAKALLFCGIEDFGLTPIECQACGTPVIAYKDGGALETVVEGKTGTFFETEQELTAIITKFDKMMYNKEQIINNAARFSQDNFKKRIMEIL